MDTCRRFILSTEEKALLWQTSLPWSPACPLCQGTLLPMFPIYKLQFLFWRGSGVESLGSSAGCMARFARSTKPGLLSGFPSPTPVAVAVAVAVMLFLKCQCSSFQLQSHQAKMQVIRFSNFTYCIFFMDIPQGS